MPLASSVICVRLVMLTGPSSTCADPTTKHTHILMYILYVHIRTYIQ